MSPLMKKPPARRPAGPPAHDLNVPVEVLRASLQFMRDDLAASVNALNNHLNAILDATRAIAEGAGRPAPEAERELAKIREEVRRAAGITSRLLHRADVTAPEGPPAAGQPAPAAQPSVVAAHVLVVEDDADKRTVITRLLYRLGHRVTACANGVEAMGVLELGPVDCIISDLRMPALGGRSLYEQVEEQMPNLARRFVFVTGDYTTPESRAFLERVGQPVVAKPYEVAELLAAVAAVLRRRS
ncbi:MAG TPA: response regulator [Gemmatimonadales bacterium]|nr:response regulator [Gemmatimonadales bacterium]